MTNKTTPRLTPSIRRKMLSLLHMEYKPSELAEVLGVHRKTIDAYVSAGLPCRKDNSGRFWIVGTSFEEWAKKILSTYNKPKKPLAEKEFYCVRCRERVQVKEYTRRRNGNTDLLRGVCPNCEGTVVKFAKGER